MILTEGFLLGIAGGGACLAYCGPVLVPYLLEMRGSMAITRSEMLQGHTPFCHMVIPTTVIPAALSRTIIFPGSMLEGFASIGTMLVLWLGATLALGRGWCSWGCFYGGLDEGFSKLGRRPLLQKIGRKWTYLPFAVLLAIALTSAATLTPTYCRWLCPFKAVTEFEAVTSVTLVAQTAIFISLFVGLVIVLPLLTKRRTQCSLFCPMEAFQSFTNKVSIFEIRIDPEKCVQCGRCENTCPTLSIDRASILKGKACLTCTKCGRCIDECPKGAIAYHIRGTPVGVRPQVARTVDHGTYQTLIHQPVFDGLVGQKKYGFVQIQWRPKDANLPELLEEQIDVNADGAGEFRIRLNTTTNTASLETSDGSVLSVGEVLLVGNGRLARVNLRR